MGRGLETVVLATKPCQKNKLKGLGPSLPSFQRRDCGSRIHLLSREDASCPAFREKGSLSRPLLGGTLTTHSIPTL